MTTKLGVLAVGLGMLAGSAVPLLAHHSFAAEYDQSKRITMKGKFVRMDWVNPHSWVYFDVTDDAGKTTTWKAEMPPPNILYRNGWRPTMLHSGDEMTISGNLAKDASNLMWAGSITFSDGRVFSMGSRPDEQRQPEK